MAQPSFYALHVGGPALSAGSGFVWFDDFLTVAGKASTVTDTGDFLVTQDGSGSRVVSDAGNGGLLKISPATGAGDFQSLQWNGETCVVAQDRIFKFAIRFRCNDTDDLDFFVGLATTDTTGTTKGPVLDSIGSAATNVEQVGFCKTDSTSSASFKAICTDDTAQTITSAVGTLTDDTFVELAFEFKGGTNGYVRYFVNGVLVATHTTNLPDVGIALTPTIEIGSPTGTTATYFEVDWIALMGERLP